LPNFSGQIAFDHSAEVTPIAKQISIFSGSEGQFITLVKEMVYRDYEVSGFVSDGRYVLTRTDAALQLIVNDWPL